MSKCGAEFQSTSAVATFEKISVTITDSKAKILRIKSSPKKFLKNLREHLVTFGVFLVRISQTERDDRLILEKIFTCLIIGELISDGNIPDAEPIKFLAQISEVGKEFFMVGLLNRNEQIFDGQQ